MNKEKDQEKKIKVNSVQKALDILNCLDSVDTELNLTQISRMLKIPKSTLFGLLKTLESASFIHMNKNDDYQLGLKCMQLGYHVRNSLPIIQFALPYLAELQRQTGQNIYLTTHREGRLLFLDGLYHTGLPIKHSVSGKMLFLHCTSSGKSIMSFMTRSQIDTIINKHGLPSSTINSIVDKNYLFGELEKSKKNGYAIDNEEETLGVRCVGVAIRNTKGEPAGALSISGPVQSIGDSEVVEYVKLLTKACSAFSEAKWCDRFPVKFL